MIKALTRNTSQTELSNGKHHILADGPLSANGTDLDLKPQNYWKLPWRLVPALLSLWI